MNYNLSAVLLCGQLQQPLPYSYFKGQSQTRIEFIVCFVCLLHFFPFERFHELFSCGFFSALFYLREKKRNFILYKSFCFICRNTTKIKVHVKNALLKIFSIFDVFHNLKYFFCCCCCLYTYIRWIFRLTFLKCILLFDVESTIPLLL